MQTDHQKTFFLPGPELNNLISDRVSLLKNKNHQINEVEVLLWVEDMNGGRVKFCKMNIRLTTGDFCVTKCGSTYSLALLDAIRTVRSRIVRMKTNNKL